MEVCQDDTYVICGNNQIPPLYKTTNKMSKPLSDKTKIKRLEKQIQEAKAIFLAMNFMGTTQTLTPQLQDAISSFQKSTE